MRNKHFVTAFLAISLLVFCVQTSAGQNHTASSNSAQSSMMPGFQKGSMFLGPHIGLAAFGSAPAFGAYFETGVTEPGKAGPGIIGIAARFDYFGFSDVYWKYSWLAFGVFANYHFAMDAKMWDPFVGLGLGYQNVSVSTVGDNSLNLTSAWGSGVYFAGNAGVRYFFSPSFDARA